MKSYYCDWPVGGSVCGKEAKWFIDQGSSHRPVCAEHATGNECHKLGLVDPAKVPHKWPTQAERAAQADEKPQFISGITEPPPRPSRPPLRDVMADLAAALLETAKEKVEDWRKR